MSMYTLLAGRHPLFDYSDSVKQYSEKLMDPVFEFPENFSESARDFFGRLCRKNPDSRYTAEEALQHPWITRDFNAKIPLSIYDETRYNIVRDDLIAVVRSLVFLSHLPTAQIYIDTPVSRRKKFIGHRKSLGDNELDFKYQCRRQNLEKIIKKNCMKRQIPSTKLKISERNANNTERCIRLKKCSEIGVFQKSPHTAPIKAKLFEVED